MITVFFDEKNEYARAAGLWQWDYGQVLRIQGLTLPTAVEIHFSLTETGGQAITPVFRRSTRKVPSFSSRHFFISFPASRFFLYLQQIFNALLGLFLLKKFF